MPTILATSLLVDGRLTGPGHVVMAGGRVTEVRAGWPPAAADHVVLRGGVLTAGLVDIQVNGGFGVDLATADRSGWEQLARGLAAHGVTAFQPTFLTAPIADLRAALWRTARCATSLTGTGCARVIGAHLEGPFLSPARAGAHPPHLMRPPTPEALDALLAHPLPAGLPTMVTLAPELPGAISAIQRLRATGITVSIGHSDATAAEVAAATTAGASMVTHVFNAQRGLSHREPGVAGQALDDHRLRVGLIPDLLHVLAPVCRLVMAVAGGRVVLVSDATAAAGMPPGRYVLGGQPVEVTGAAGTADGVPRTADGTIAGSALCLDRGVANLVRSGCDLATVLDAATRGPADALSRPDLGRLAVGSPADVVWWSDEPRVRRVWLGGEPVTGPTCGTH